ALVRANPTTDQSLSSLVTKPALPPEPRQWKNGGYIQGLPKDPWGNDYLYINPGVHGEIDIFSYGADGREGGEGPCPDVGNWQKQ
ncbi:MAG: type II secretion system major pseudopilin GspG, partial [Pseudomonadota bacterium]